MRKFAVFSGFLGSGKTSTMIALTKYYTATYGKAAMISNDLGGKGLADHRLAKLQGCNAAEITDECICFCHDVLRNQLELFYADGVELVVSDIPGFGVGALEHVYHGLEHDYPAAFEFAPFTVLTEPGTVQILSSGREDDMASILQAQLQEADLIVLNKCDLLSEDEKNRELRMLGDMFPHAEVIGISARTGDGLEELSRKLTEGKASMHHPDIDYEDKDLQHAMGMLSEYYIQYHAQVCCDDFDGTAYLEALAAEIQQSIRAGGYEIPHLKLLAWSPEGDYGKVDLLGADRAIEISHRFSQPCVDLAVTLNTTAACPPEELDAMILSAIESVSTKYRLELLIFKKECIGLGEEE